MGKACLVCSDGVLDTIQFPRSVNIMLHYVLGCQKKEDQLLCRKCYNELIIAFNFKRKFYHSRRLKLKQLKKIREVAELEHNYVQKQGQLSVCSNIQKAGQLHILTKGIKYAAQNQDGSLGLEDTSNYERRYDEPTSSKVCCKPQIEGQYKEANPTTIEARKDFTNSEHLQNNGETSNLYYTVKLLGSDKNSNVVPLDEGNDKENENKAAETVQNQKDYSREGAGIKLKNKEIDGKEFTRHDNSNKLANTQCVFCFRTFSKLEGLEDHKKIHQIEEHPYKCPNVGCKAHFKYWHSRERHIIVHTETKMNVYARAPPGKTPWICHYCGRDFPLKEIFDSHIKAHSRDTNFECQHCFKSFASNNNLQMHLRIHTKGSPYECNQCGRPFISFTRLEVHKRVHSGFKPFKCEVCKAAFITSSGLIKHWRMNSHFRGAIKPSDPNLNNT